MRFTLNHTYVLSIFTILFSLLVLGAVQAAEDTYVLAPGESVVPVAHGFASSHVYKRDWLSDLWNSWFTPTSNIATTSSAKPSTTSKISSSNTKSSSKSSTSQVKTSTSSVRSTTSGSKSNVLASSTTSSKTSSTAKAAIVSESIATANVIPSSAIPAAPVATIATDGGINTNTTGATNATTTAHTNATTNANTYLSTVLVIARDTASSYNAWSGLNGYGIPFQILIVPQSGASLPVLNSSATVGNFGGIIVLSEVSYDYSSSGRGFASALTSDQWSALYAYQTTFGIRMVRLDVYPSSDSGTTALGGCCEDGQEQLFSFSNTKNFTQAGLITGATLSSKGLYHYPAQITDKSIAAEIAQFGVSSGFSSPSTAAVINTFAGGRQQMVFFMSFATSWSETSNFIQHAFIQWMTRGLYSGYRRINLGTQVDDMFLNTAIYPVNGTIFRLRPADLDTISAWIPKINAKMPAGSKYFMEIGHNGNGNIDYANDADSTKTLCGTGAIQYKSPATTALEFQKPLGSGTSLWPNASTNAVLTYPYSIACTNNDPLKVWWSTPVNRDLYAHISHTFSHEEENNATFFDITNEITWNQAWLKQTTLASASMFSDHGVIPPAITGLHNGDALRAWYVGGIKNAVGDNTRPALLNPKNEHWPLMTTVANNGYDGIQITPRWSSNIYYNCDQSPCIVQEWEDVTGQSGTIDDILAIERQTSAVHLLSLRHDANMFHQANLRVTDVTPIAVNGAATAKWSLIQAWVETVVNEITRLVNWPLITLKQDDLAQSFANRMTRDQCSYNIQHILNNKAKTITGLTVTATGNTCSAPIPVTVPGKVTDTQSFTTEQIGNDPLTIWVQLTGKAVTFTLSSPIPW